jgi:hypothetical protein
MIEIRKPAADKITHRAYALYLMRGCEQGRDAEDCFKAEKEVCDESSARQAPMIASHLTELPYAWPVGN